MTTRVDLEPAFMIHRRLFRDSSLLVDFFTRNHGLICAVVKGARNPKTKLRGILIPFVPLLISWVRKSDLATISKIEPNGVGCNFVDKRLLSAIYLNELLIKLLHRDDAHVALYAAYQDTLMRLNAGKNIALFLRIFEKKLLQEIGYGLSFEHDIHNDKIAVDKYYIYQHEHGFIPCAKEQNNCYLGQSLLALHQEQFSSKQELQDSKHLMQQVLQAILGDKQIKTRELLGSSLDNGQQTTLSVVKT